jgi:N-methylhydantoinase B
MLIQNAEIVMRHRIRACPDGEYCSEGYVESNGHTDEPLVARLRLSIHDDAVNVNFWDASPQTAGPTNVGPAMAINSAGTILKAFLDPETPINHGSFQPIEVSAPEGTFINARPPVACGGSVEVKALLDALIAGALGQAIPDRMVGDLKGGGNHVYISGYPRGIGRHGFFLFYEYPAGGTGATKRGDGSHATRTYTEGDFNTIGSAEIIESEMPLRVEQTSIRNGSHGHGMYRGGCGLTRDIRILEEGASLSVLSDKNIIPPYGVAGAHSGRGNRFVVMRGGEVIESSPIPGKIGGFELQPGDLVRMETAGGGGHGDPLQRAPSLVANDVQLGYMSREEADSHYGVIVTSNGDIDEPATRERRARLAHRRNWVKIKAVGNDEYCGARRRFVVSTALAKRLAVEDGALCELVNPHGPSLRGWIGVDERQVAPTSLALGPFGRAVLRSNDGDTFEMRPIR